AVRRAPARAQGRKPRGAGGGQGGRGERGRGVADKRADRAPARAGGVFAGWAAGFAPRKLVPAGWKKVPGKEPPADPRDPHVSVVEALSWAIVLGVAMETARLVAIRVTTKQLARAEDSFNQ